MHALADPAVDSSAEIVIHLVGELDAATTPGLRLQFDQALASGLGPITLDCSSLTFIDAGALGALVHLSKGARAEQRSIELRNVNPWISRLIAIGGLASMLLADHPVGLAFPDIDQPLRSG